MKVGNLDLLRLIKKTCKTREGVCKGCEYNRRINEEFICLPDCIEASTCTEEEGCIYKTNDNEDRCKLEEKPLIWELKHKRNLI